MKKEIPRRTVGDNPSKDIILAEGEVTGHAHRIPCLDEEAALYEVDGRQELHVFSAVKISHEEHHTRIIPPGIYENNRQREWDYIGQMQRQVAD